MRESLRQQLRDNAYPSYVYGIQHKLRIQAQTI